MRSDVLTTKWSIEDWSPNISQLAERLLLGPQREILQKIEDINMHYGLDLRATKTYRWSPGYMEQIKSWMTDKYVEPHMKRKISTFFNQIDNKKWLYDSLSRKLNQIDDQMGTRRRDGAMFQDNTSLIEDRVKIFKDRLTSQLLEANHQFNDARIYVSADTYVDGNGKEFFGISASLPVSTMNVFIGSTSYSIQIGAVDLWFITPLNGLIYSLCNSNSIITDDEFVLNEYFSYHGSYSSTQNRYLGTYYPEWECNNPAVELSHPYISRNRNYQGGMYINDNEAKYVCLGDLLGNVNRQLKHLDLVSLCATLMTWHSTFHAGRTNPLNGIRKSYWGLPYDTTEFRNLTSRSASECPHNNDELRDEYISISYCDSIDCKLKADCNLYLDFCSDKMYKSLTKKKKPVEEEYDDVDPGWERIQEDNETTEESIIRWAAERGGAINTGGRNGS